MAPECEVVAEAVGNDVSAGDDAVIWFGFGLTSSSYTLQGAFLFGGIGW